MEEACRLKDEGAAAVESGDLSAALESYRGALRAIGDLQDLQASQLRRNLQSNISMALLKA